MNEELYEEGESGQAKLAYIRTVSKSETSDAPDDAPEMLYALYDGEGRTLAVLSSHDVAVAMARSNNFDPATVH